MSNTVSLKLREKLPVTESQFAFTVICEDFIYLREHHISGIPEIQELVEEDGQLYVIEEYINGVSLKEVLDERGPLPFQVAANYMQQLCLILQPLHTLYPPIVHRDIKPEILLSYPLESFILLISTRQKKPMELKAGIRFLSVLLVTPPRNSMDFLSPNLRQTYTQWACFLM